MTLGPFTWRRIFMKPHILKTRAFTRSCIPKKSPLYGYAENDVVPMKALCGVARLNDSGARELCQLTFLSFGLPSSISQSSNSKELPWGAFSGCSVLCKRKAKPHKYLCVFKESRLHVNVKGVIFTMSCKGFLSLRQVDLLKTWMHIFHY